jgi:heat shock protein HslJ
MKRIITRMVVVAAAAVLLWNLPSFAGGKPREGGRTASETTALTDGAIPPLAGTEWRLVSFQSMDDSIGEVRPEDPSRFTMHLNADGTVAFRLDCNRARGNWSAEPAGDETSGRFTFGELVSTRALCPPPHLDEWVVGQAGFVRGYLLKDQRLYLTLMADGGIFTWEPSGAQ